VALNLERKKAIVTEVAEIAANSLSAVVADYRGLTVAEMTELRKRAREKNISMRVVRNTLAKRALKDTEFECLLDTLLGPVILVFAKDEPGAAARLVHDFIKEKHEKLEVKALAIGPDFYTADQLSVIAKLPSKDEAIALLMATIKAPITKLVRTLVEPHSKLVRTFAALRDKKQAA